MTTKIQKTYSAKDSDIKRKWYIVDAKDQVLGRMSTRVARMLTGKDKAIYTPHVDCGDFVIVINAEKVRLTGNKLKDKIYYRHSGYIGSIKGTPAGRMLEENPEQVITHAVKGMVPKSKLGRQIIKKLKVFRGEEHPHSAQQPELIEIK